MDPLQFAYRRNRGVEDATITLLHDTHTHLESPKSFVRVLFIDFSSAFNTIQPHILSRKLLDLHVNPKLILWLTDFLVNRKQLVRYLDATSGSRATNTGAPQGTVLAPILFTLYTNDLRSSSPLSKLYKYSDDAALTDFSQCEELFEREVDTLSTWCKENHLALNIKKTKEMVIESGKANVSVNELSIDGEKVERVEEFRYLGTVIDSKLNFDENTAAIVKRCNQRLFCLYRFKVI